MVRAGASAMIHDGLERSAQLVVTVQLLRADFLSFAVSSFRLSFILEYALLLRSIASVHCFERGVVRGRPLRSLALRFPNNNRTTS